VVEVDLHSFLTSVSDGGESLTSHHSHFTAGKGPLYPLNRRLNGLQSWYKYFREENNFLPWSGFEPCNVQHVTVGLGSKLSDVRQCLYMSL
jgi:hypothetical protein